MAEKRGREPVGIAPPASVDGVITTPPDCSDFVIPRESELRVTVPMDVTDARIQVLPPLQRDTALDAEVFGAPLAVGYVYRLRPGSDFAVWSHRGCTLRAQGTDLWRATGFYRAPATHYRAVLEYHGIIHTAREAAKTAGLRLDAADATKKHANAPLYDSSQAPSAGPRVVICGAGSSGRHSVARVLANYAVRQPAGWAPTVVDIDPNHQTFGPCGTVGVGAWEYTATVDEDVTHLPHSLYWAGAQSVLLSSAPEHEAATAAANVSSVYAQAAASAVRAATQRIAAQPHGSIVRWSGSITVLPSFPDPIQGAKFIASVVNSNVATHVLVVGDPDLLAALLTRFEATLSPALARDTGVFTTAHGTPFQIDQISASTGAVDYSLPGIEGPMRNLRLRQYFQGVRDVINFVPIRVELPFSMVDVLRLADVDGQASPQRIAEAKYAHVAEKRIGALYRARDSIQTSPLVFPCHVESVEGTTIAVTICGVLNREPGERFTLVVGSVTWLE
jgi:hypothetical protein